MSESNDIVSATSEFEHCGNTIDYRYRVAIPHTAISTHNGAHIGTGTYHRNILSGKPLNHKRLDALAQLLVSDGIVGIYHRAAQPAITVGKTV